MKKKFRSVLNFICSRIFLISFLLLIQIVLLVSFVLSWQHNEWFSWLYSVLYISGGFIVIKVICDNSNPSYKIAWIIPILVFPVFGALFYLIFRNNSLALKEKKKLAGIETRMKTEFTHIPNISDAIRADEPLAANQSDYIKNYAYCPPYSNTYSEYLPSGEAKWIKMLDELDKAKHFIFLEYFIIEEGEMWSSILKILEKKAAEGVDVRVIYDDMGCIQTLPYGYEKTLRKKGINACIFNSYRPVLSGSQNNRDHRKICVIDGIAGFTGGINLADEYINAVEKHGHWKDTSIFLKGPAVWNLTVMFLSMWNFVNGLNEDFSKFRPKEADCSQIKAKGIVQPFSDSPFDDEAVGETVYMNLISKARNYVYITTPYLIIDNEMITALSNAAKSGVDVRIITPHIADKKVVHITTRSYYKKLIEAGVRIYEYAPGFIHAKTFVVDDVYAVVGTINLDYRSLYLHFECATWLYKTDSVFAIKDDFLKTLGSCIEYTVEMCDGRSPVQKTIAAFCRLFAPLM